MARVVENKLSQLTRERTQVEAAVRFVHKLPPPLGWNRYASIVDAGTLRLQLPAGRVAQLVDRQPEIAFLDSRRPHLGRLVAIDDGHGHYPSIVSRRSGWVP